MEWADRVGHRIKLRDLHIVMAVAQWGSMAKAAERLAISHPVISRTISDLEHTLGVRLLDRSAQGVELTVYGRELLKCGTAVFDEMRQGLKNIEFLNNADSGELRIGCPEAIAAGLLPPIAQLFSEQYPGVQLHVDYADTARGQFQELRARAVELLIGPISMPFSQGDLILQRLFEQQFFVVVGAQSQWARRRRIQLRDLMGEPWVLPPPDSVPGRLIAQIFATSKLPVPRASIVNLSIHLTTALLASGRFVALLPGYVAQFDTGRPIKVLPAKLPAQRVSVGIITVKNRTISPLAMRFMECAREVARPLAYTE